MGYAFLVAAPERALLSECGVVDVRASSTAAERLLAISEASTSSSAGTTHCLAVERLYFNKNVQTAMRVEARAWHCSVSPSRLEIAEYTPRK